MSQQNLEGKVVKGWGQPQKSGDWGGGEKVTGSGGYWVREVKE